MEGYIWDLARGIYKQPNRGIPVYGRGIYGFFGGVYMVGVYMGFWSQGYIWRGIYGIFLGVYMDL